MAYLDPKQAFADLKTNVVSGLQAHFPITGTKQSLHLESLDVREKDHDPGDLEAQHRAKVTGGSWTVPVFGTVALKNNETGDVIDRKTIKLADIPQMTPRYSYLVNGKEYQVDNQWRLKSGVYTQRKENGELKTQFATAGKKGIDSITFDPETKIFHAQKGSSETIPVYPLMKQLGVDDDTLEKSWGKEILNANRNVRGAGTALESLFKASKKRAPTSPEEAQQHFVDTMLGATVRPESTQVTLGKPYTHINGDLLHDVTTKMIGVQRGDIPEDQRDSLVFKDLHTLADVAKEQLTDWKTKKAIQLRVARKINSATSVRDVVRGDMFTKPITAIFTNNSLSRHADQVNPAEMIASSFQTTIMGKGGINSEYSVSDPAKLISPSHVGFLDPIHTPEGSKTGVTSHLPLAVSKSGNTPMIPAYNLRTQKMESIDPLTFHSAKVVMPDQVRWGKNGPVPVADKVAVSQKGNEIADSSFKDADYVLRHPSQLFSLTSNLIPFLGNNSGNRASYATHHIEQAISLRDREAPLVQVGTGRQGGAKTFEDLVGQQSAHISPVGGTVKAVTPNHIIVTGSDGKDTKVGIYNNYPLNDAKAVLHSTPVVKPGDTVTSGQLLADNNFTRGGQLALGKNLRVGYIPMKGYNFEDGVVISETGAKKMSSEHLYKPSTRIDPDAITGLSAYKRYHPSAYDKEQLSKLGDDGIVRTGQIVQPGDPLVVATKPYDSKGSLSLSKIRKSLSTQQSDLSVSWKGDHPGEVVGVHRDDNGAVTVHVRTVEPMQVGDKIAGRYGNKGIITAVIPDHEMPHTINENGEKEPIEIALNPSGIPGRMNMGQVLETAASKIALKTGKPYIVNNFEHGVDALEKVQNELKEHGISDTEVLHDPLSGKELGPALVGHQQILKLNFQIDKKVSVRSGMDLPGAEKEYHDADTLIPASGGKTGAQSMGNLGMYSMLAHGAKANIREMQTWKSESADPKERWNSLHHEVWNAIQNGEVPPPPKKTFAFQKFEDMLRGAGIDTQKKGHQLQLTPLTNQQILKMSAGELPDPVSVVYSKADANGEPAVRRGGLFDPKLTGGHGGKKWTHIGLPEPVPNPVFENAIQSVTGLKQKDYNAVVNGESAIHKETGEVVPLGTENSLAGGAGIAHLLSKIDVKKELEDAKSALDKYKVPEDVAHRTGTLKVDTLSKKVRFLGALDKLGMQPRDAYVLDNLPVMPPVMRPATFLPSGDVSKNDVNELYSRIGDITDAMKHPNFQYGGDQRKKQARTDLYDAAKAVMGLGENWKDLGKNPKGLLVQIAGPDPKNGYFQGTLLSRRQDMTMRGTITPEPGLGLDNVGLPEKKALDLFRPFVIKKMVDSGAALSPRDAQAILAQPGKPSAQVYRALDKVMQERPVLLKRDPSLHKHSVQAFYAQRVAGKAIQIHPLVTGGFGADFDGDAMAVYVPIGKDAVEEAKKMVPSANIYNEASGKVIYQPSLESSLGLFKLSRVTGDSGKSFDTHADLLKAVQSGQLKMTDKAQVGGKTTTAGRVMLTTALPEAMHTEVLHNLDLRLDKKGVNKMYTTVAKDHTSDFADTASKLMRLGYDTSFGAIKLQNPQTAGTAASVQRDGENPKEHVQFLPMGTHSLSLSDFTADKAVRDPIVRAAQKTVDAIHARTDLNDKEKERQSNATWFAATDKMTKEHEDKMTAKPNNLFIMQQAGVKPGPMQYRQLRLAPMLMVDSANKIIPRPITKSYAEGLDLGSYWSQMSAARRGSVLKVQEVQEPGVFTKRLMNTTMGLVVTKHDCGTEQGIHLPVSSQDVFDRTLAQDHTVGGVTYEKGTVITPQVASAIKAADKGATLLVRSPLKCEHTGGICQKCVGIGPGGQHYDLGTNVGILATQALGERATQLTLKAFHTGGLATKGPDMVNDFIRVQQLTYLPEKIPNAARLAEKDGVIDKIEEDPTGHVAYIGGVAHHIPNDPYGNPLFKPLSGTDAVSAPGGQKWSGIQVGMKVRAGQSLTDPSRTNINLRDLYRVTGNMNEVQNQMVTELHDIYGREGVRRQNTETVVRAMGDLTRVVDSGDHDTLIKGQFTSRAGVMAANKALIAQGMQPIQHTPVLKGIDIMPLEVQEDWMAQLNHIRLRESLQDSAALGAVSDLHGTNPIPGIAYGAEFGMNEQHTNIHPELKGVPPHHY
jgi:DNA-directed RNA polymerase subunit beta'